MANPQTENGYTRIAHEILERTSKFDLNGTQMRIVLTIWRYTYGFNRKKYEMSVRFLCEAVGTKSRGFIDSELSNLINRKVIIQYGIGPNRGRILGFNKNFDEWLSKEKEEVKKEVVKPKKEKAPKKKAKKYDEDNTYYKMAKTFLELVKVSAKEAGVSHVIEKANLQSWADEFRKLYEIDKVQDKQQILQLMKWTTQHHFWYKNIRSAKKFRDKYADLAVQMVDESKLKQNMYKHPSHNQTDGRDYEIALNKWISKGGDPDEFVYSK
ncbi:hypothetical protein BTS2_0505 [Bacillus sp. TS-2]|nr:hypothetical protein BTS2_0505 [Bacillus sp. TS-2]